MVTRIRKLLEQKQLTPTQFADLIGVGRPVMSHILSERNKPSLEVVQRIISAFPELSLPWLLSGVGEMLVETPASATPDLPVTIEPVNPALELPPAAPIAAEPAAVVGAVAAAPAAPSNRPDALAGEPKLKDADEIPASLVSPAPAPPSQAGLAPRFMPAPPASLAPAQVPFAAPKATPTGEIAEAPAVPGSVPSPPQIKPFRAARFTPKAAVVPTEPAPLPASPALPEPAALAPLAVPSPVSVQASAPAIPAPADVMLPFLSEPGKAIRRIVIFYRDGSFADYQPEQ